jgi:hypothetical protein
MIEVFELAQIRVCLGIRRSEGNGGYWGDGIFTTISFKIPFTPLPTTSILYFPNIED